MKGKGNARSQGDGRNETDECEVLEHLPSPETNPENDGPSIWGYADRAQLDETLYLRKTHSSLLHAHRNRLLKHKFEFLEDAVEKGNDGDYERGIAAIKTDLRCFGFDL